MAERREKRKSEEEARREGADVEKGREMNRTENRMNGDGKYLITAKDRKDEKRRERKRMGKENRHKNRRN